MDTYRITLADPSFATDRQVVGALARMINDGFARSEWGLWTPGSERITEAAVASHIASGELVVVRYAGTPVAAARVRRVTDRDGECTLIVRVPEHRGHRLGERLLDFAERWGRGLGLERMRTELMTTREPLSSANEYLRGWLESRGYRQIGTGNLADWHPELRPRLATDGDYLVFYKVFKTS